MRGRFDTLRVAVLAGVMIFVVAGLPVVAVERAPACPDVAALVSELDLQIDTAGRPGAVAGSEAEHRLHVEASSVGRLHVEVVDASGRVELTREVSAAGPDCGAHARAVAVVIERWLSGLPLPRAEGRRGRRAPARRAWLAVQAGPVVTLGLAPFDPFVGLGLGAAVRPIDALRLTLDGALHLPHGPDAGSADVSVLRGVVRVRATGVLAAGRFELEAGPSLRLDVTSVGWDRGDEARATVRASPGLGVALGAAARLGRRTSVEVVLEPWLALDGQTFYLADEPRQDVHRTPGGGVEVGLVGRYELF